MKRRRLRPLRPKALETLLKPNSERLSIYPQALRRDPQRACAVDPADKPLRKTMGAKGCADHTRQMAAPLAPVETWTAQQAARLPPAPLPHGRNVDPDPLEKCQTAPGENA